MSIKLPNLDDRAFADLVAEAKGMIPQLAPSWTDHNPSDPGVTLIELFASISEMLMYRANRVTESNKRVFLQLLMGDNWFPPVDDRSLDQLITTALEELRREERAISNADFEKFALEAGTFSGHEKSPVARAYCRAKRNYDAAPESAKYSDAVGHVSLVIIARVEPFNSDAITKADGLAAMVKEYLEPRRLLTTKLHVVPAKYLGIGVRFTLSILDDYRWAEVEHVVLEQIEKFFHPIDGGRDGKGWTPGEPVYAADIYALLDQLPGVDFVEIGSDELFKTDDDSLMRKIRIEGSSEIAGLEFPENVLPQFKAALSNVHPYVKGATS